MFVRSLKCFTKVKLNVSTNFWFISISSWCARDMLRWRWCCTCSRRTPGSRHSRAHTAMTATKNIFIVNQKIFLKSELFFRCHAMTVAGLIITWESSQRGSATFTSSLPILSAGLEPSTCNVTMWHIHIELQTNIRKHFKITEKAPTRASSWLKVLSH